MELNNINLKEFQNNKVGTRKSFHDQILHKITQNLSNFINHHV